MTQPDDRELEQYLAGGSKLSRRYRDASGESAPADLDEAILARARAELRRKPSLNRLLTPVAIAASLLLGVNLAYNVYRSEPMPAQEIAGKRARDAFAPNPPPPASEAPVAGAAPASPVLPQSKARTAPAEAPAGEVLRERAAAPAAREEDKREDLAQAEQRAAQAREQVADSQSSKMTASRNAAGASAHAAPAPMALADAAPLSESARIDRLIEHVRTLEGAVFVRNGKEYGPAEAAKHMQLKREKAGDRCDTADEFIRTCASFSSMSGEAYLIRFRDGRTRTAEDVLREELATLR